MDIHKNLYIHTPVQLIRLTLRVVITYLLWNANLKKSTYYVA